MKNPKFILLCLGALFCLLAPAVSANIAQDLFVYYPFDGNDNDASGNDRTSPGNSGDYVVGQFGQAFNITPTSDYFGVVPPGELSGEATICAWFNGTDQNYLLYADNPGANNVLSFGLNTGGGIGLNDGSWRASDATFSGTGYRHACWVLDGNSKFQVYFNGANSGTNTTYSGTLDLNGSNFLNIGRVGQSDIEGAVDEFAIWERALSGDEINDIYSNGIDISGLTINAFDVVGDSVNNFNVTFTNGSFFSTTNGSIVLPTWANGNYTATARGENRISETKSFEHINQTTVNYELALDNEVFFNFLDEDTQAEILNVSYTLFSDSFSVVANTTTGNVTFSSLPNGFYTLEYTSSGYTTRRYFLDVPLATDVFVNNTAYLINESEATTFVLTVRNQNNQPISDTIAYLQRGYIISGGYDYEIVEMMRPSFSLGGSVPFSAYANTVPYAFTIIKDGQTIFSGVASTEEDTDTFFLIDTELFINVNIGATGFQSYQNIQGLTGNISFVNATNTFRVAYNDAGALLSQACLSVRFANNNSFYGQDCSSDGADILLVTVDNTTNASYVADFMVTESSTGTRYVIDSLSKSYENNTASLLFGTLGLLITVLTLILVATTLATNPAIMIVAMALTIVSAGTMLLGLVVVPIVLQGTILIASFIIAYMVGDNK